MNLKEQITDNLWVIFLGITCILVCFFQPIGKVVVSGESMEATLYDGDHGWILKWDNIERYDIIVFCNGEDQAGDQELLIKRVIGLPGDHVACYGKTVYVNGTPIIEFAKDANFNTDFDTVVVPQDSYFVLGDNREVSLDSRYEEVGFVNKSNILGVFYE